jgi:hypothetical protein
MLGGAVQTIAVGGVAAGGAYRSENADCNLLRSRGQCAEVAPRHSAPPDRPVSPFRTQPNQKMSFVHRWQAGQVQS